MKPIGRLILSSSLAIAIALIATFAVENRAPVTVDFWPLPWTLHPPLYFAVLGAGAIGLILGGLLCGAARLRLWLRARASESRAERIARAAAAAPAAAPPAPSVPAVSASPGRALAPRARAAVDEN